MNRPAETPENAAATRDPVWDYLRVIAAIAVVGIHALGPWVGTLRAAGGRSGLMYMLDRSLFVAVPLFLFVSGALVWGSCEQMGLARYGRFLKRRAFVVGLPYLAWCAVYFALWPLVGREWPHGVRSGLWLVWRLVVSGGASYHLYYVPLLFVLYLLTPVARRVGAFSPEIVLLAVLAIRVWWGPAIVTWVDATWDRDLYTYLAEHAAINAPFMALGAWYALRRCAADRVIVRAWPLLLVAGAAMYATGWYQTLERFSVEALRVGEFLALGLLALGLCGAAAFAGGRAPGAGARIASLAALTYGVYLAHPAVLFGVRRVLGVAGAGAWMNGAVAAVAIWGFVATATFALVWGLSRMKWLRWSVGL